MLCLRGEGVVYKEGVVEYLFERHSETVFTENRYIEKAVLVYLVTGLKQLIKSSGYCNPFLWLPIGAAMVCEDGH